MKNVTEWSVEFDVMWNNLMSNQAPGLNEYEKSVCLTNAQEQLVLDYLSPKTNIKGEGFDDGLIRQSDFSTLIVTDVMASFTPTKKLDARPTTKYYKYPASDILIVLNEMCTETVNDRTLNYVVVPISYDEYMRLMSKPFKYPLKGQAWRLISGLSTTPTVELVARFSGTVTYVLRYVRRPAPIILGYAGHTISPTIENLDGSTQTASSQPCELPEHLHQEILRRAVNLAKTAWSDPVVEQRN